MTIVFHEIRQNWQTCLLWTASIALLLTMCIFLYPEMEGEVAGLNLMFSSMGSFTKAFGMDQLDIGSFAGFYAVECGTILGLGGAFFACLTGASMLAKEECGRTAEFLLSHPVSRRKIVIKKFMALMMQIIVMNGVLFLTAAADIAGIGEAIPWTDLLLIHVSSLLMQIELGAICFAVSAFLSGNSAGLAMGMALTAYFLNLAANISDKAAFLKNITPFGYSDAADVVSEGQLNTPLLLLGLILSAACLLLACFRYAKKDIH